MNKILSYCSMLGMVLLLVGFAPQPAARAQARATSSRSLQLSAFGELNGTWTGLADPGAARGGRNLAFTLGGDLGLYDFHRVLLGAEVRGTYPLDSGQIVGQKSVLVGLRAQRRYGRLIPFGNLLVGRGSLDYENGGYIAPPLIYFSTNTTVYDGGGGVEVDVRPALALKVEAQVQRWDTPVTASGHIYTKQVGVGLVYRFGANASPRLGKPD